MSALEQISANVNTQEGAPDPSKPLGTLEAGAQILAKVLASYPTLADAAQVISAMGVGGNEQMEQSGGKTYNGTVDFMGHPVEIKNGIGDIEGHGVYVSPGGEVVADDKGKIMGRVENGKFAVIDKAQGERLMQNKMAERGR